MPEQLTPDDLDRIFIRVQSDDSAAFSNVSIKEASDLQFDTWAKTRMQIKGSDTLWNAEERADFCNRLYQQGELAVIKKEAMDKLGL